MEVWVVKTSEMLAGDNSSGRLLRSGLIAQLLERRGHRVTWWMSTFDHANRRQREPGDSSRAYGSNGIIRMIASPGYERSISARRLLDHRIWGRRFARAIATAPPPDVIFCAYPTIESASVCARYGLARGIPVVVDLRDMWPDIFLEAFPGMLRPLARAGVWSVRASARRALRQATALFGITEEFLTWGLELAGRSRSSFDRAFPLAYPDPRAEAVTLAERLESAKYWDGLDVRSDNAFNVVVIGAMTKRRYEMNSVLGAARTLASERRPVKFVIVGDGNDLPGYELAAKDCPNVLFPGWLGMSRIQELLSRAHLGLVPYRSTPDLVISIPNKVGEYLAHGVPVATCLRGTLARLLREKCCGMSYDPSNPESLVRIVRSLRDDEALLAKLRTSSRRVFEEDLSAEKVYTRLADELEEIAVSCRKPRQSHDGLRRFPSDDRAHEDSEPCRRTRST
jgi:glycosyltransferase involved in cell wall biosynthesis